MNRFLAGVAGSLLFRVPFWIIAWWTLPTLCNWDCWIYSELARSYTAPHSAFFPLFPLLAGGVSRLLPFLSPQACVVLVSNLFVPISGALFLVFVDGLWADGLRAGALRGELAGAGTDPGAQPSVWRRRVAGFQLRSWFALLLLSVFPEGHFWMRGYSEPVFFALLMAILLGLKQRNWLLAGACCGLIAVTRPQGVWVDGIVGAYLLWEFFGEFLRRPRIREGSPVKTRARLALSVLLCALPFLLFMAWLWKQTGNPLYFYVAQHDWGRRFDLLSGLKDQLPRWDASHLYLYLGLWAGIRFLRRPSLEWRVLGVLSLVLSELPVLFGGFYSYVRFASVNPALFILGSELVVATATVSGLVALAVIIWWVIRLAIQVRLAGSGWAG